MAGLDAARKALHFRTAGTDERPALLIPADEGLRTGDLPHTGAKGGQRAAGSTGSPEAAAAATAEGPVAGARAPAQRARPEHPA